MYARLSLHVWLCLASLTLPALSKVIWTDGDENGNATLVCPEGERTQWITPSLLVINPNFEFDINKYMFDDVNSSLLTVMDLKDTDAGVYICGIPTSDTEEPPKQDKSVQIELHVKLPYHDTDYTDNAITGVVVAVIVACIFGGSCLLYKYRYKEKSFTDMEIVVDPSFKVQKIKDAEPLPQKMDSARILENRSRGEGCENPALVESDSDSDDDQKKQKEDVPLDVTTEQTHSATKETEETGM